MKKVAKFFWSRRYARLIAACNGLTSAAVCENLECRTLLSGLSFSPSTIKVGVPVFAIQAADLNNDNHVDIVTANDNGTVSIFLANANGTFKPAVTIPDGFIGSTDGSSDSVVVTDLGNGHPDIIVADGRDNEINGQINVLIGIGDGTFNAPIALMATNSNVNGGQLAAVQSIAVADLGNGHPDLVTGNDDGSVTVLIGNGDGHFKAPAFNTVAAYYNGFYPSVGYVALGDITGDGKIDIIASGGELGQGFMLPGNGDGTFGQSTAISFAGTDVARVDVSNLGNGRSDLVASNIDGDISVFLNNGSGNFSLKQTIPSTATGLANDTTTFKLFDLANNGKPDLLVFQLDHADHPTFAEVEVFAGNGNGTFAPGVNSTLLLFPTTANAVDVSGDGKPDLVVGYAGHIGIRNGVGNGTFAAARAYATINEFPTDLAVSGLTSHDSGSGVSSGYSNLDLITANPDGTVSVMIGNGDGTFQPPELLETDFAQLGSKPQVVVGDVNGDGIPDLVVENRTNQISVLIGNGDGTFQDASVSTLPYQVRTMSLADVNGDGISDVVLGDYNGRVTALIGESNSGGYSDGYSYTNRFYGFTNYFTSFVAPSTDVVGVVSADVNNDGIPDLIATTSSNAVYLLIGNDSGSFGSPTPIFSDPNSSLYVSVADVNDDGEPDLIIAEKNGTVSLLLGNGAGDFLAPKVINLGINFNGGVTAADLTGDGIPDLVVGNYYSDNLLVLPGNGDGTFKAALPFTIGSGLERDQVSDFNGDGKLDIVTLQGSVISVLLNNTPSTAAGLLQPLPSTYLVGGEPKSVAVADLGNGSLDIITANQYDGSVTVLINNGSGLFLTSHTYNGFISPRAVAIADLNGDGRPDIIVAEHDLAVKVLFQNANGTFSSQPVTVYQPNSDGAYTGEVSIAAGDFEGNNRPDIVESTVYYGGVRVLRNNGDGTFSAGQMYSTGKGAYGIAVGDVNHDNKQDIVVANRYGGSVTVLLNNGFGGFNRPQTFFAGERPGSVAIADVNGDGNADLIVGSSGDYYGATGAAIDVLGGNGNGTFSQPHAIPLPGNRAGTVAAFDPQHTGFAELFVASGFQGAGNDFIDVLVNNGDGSFQTPAAYSVPLTPESIAVGDFNGDGKADVAAAIKDGDVAAVFLSTGAAPTFNSNASAVFKVGSAGLFNISTSTAAGTVITRLGTLPTGVIFTDNHNGTAKLSGTPAAGTGGTYSLTFSASVGTGSAGAQVFTLTVDQAPAITSSNHFTFDSFVPGTFTVTTSGFPAPAFGQPSNLPSGLNLVDLGDGMATIAGTPSFGTGGTYSILLTASNGIGNPVSQVFTLTVDEAPTIFTTNSFTFVAGHFGSFNIASSGFPAATFSKSGTLPTGLVFTPLANGAAKISGTPAANTAGSYTITLAAANAIGTSTQQFTLTIDQAPAFTSANHTTFIDGTPGSFTITTSANPAATFATPTGDTVPSGVSFTDNLDGTATVGFDGSALSSSAGTYVFTFSASNGMGSSASQVFTLTLDKAPTFNSTISFAAPVTYHVGGSDVFPIAGADLNGDGIDDIVSDNNNGTVSILLGNGNGTFKPAKTLSDGQSAVSSDQGGDDMTLADLGNGHQDIIVTSGYSGSVSVLIGNGDGTFKAATQVQVSNYAYAYAVAVADLGNGHPDLITTNTDASVSVLFGNGDGSFQAPNSYYVGGELKTLAVTDITGDGNADIVVTDEYNGNVQFLRGNGTGHFYSAQIIAAAGNNVKKAAVANFNGHPDLIIGNKDGTVDLSLSNGDGIFQPAFQIFTNSPGKTGPGLGVDVDNDGKLDELIGLGNQAVVLLGNGDGTFQSPIPLFTIASNNNADLEADLNGDGAIDFVGGYTNGTIEVRLNKSTNLNNGATFTTGVFGSVTISTAGLPIAKLTETGSLPTGVTFHDNLNGTALLSGTPGATTGNVYPISLNATNTVGTAVQAFTLTVDQPPTISSPNHATFITNAGSPATFTITAGGLPTSTFTQSGNLPSGIAFQDNLDGSAELTGTPAALTGGTYVLTLTADNGSATPAKQTFTLTVNDPPALNLPSALTFFTGHFGSLTITATGFPAAKFTETGALPKGVTLTTAGKLSGVPALGTENIYDITVTADNGVAPAASQSLALTVDQAPAFTSANHTTFIVGASARTFTITTTGVPAAMLSDGSFTLPTGLAFNDNGDGTASLSGSPAAGTSGTYTFTLSADNGIGSTPTNQAFTLTVDEAPTITTTNSPTFITGTAGSFIFATTGFPIATLKETGTIPVTFLPLTGGRGELTGIAALGKGGTYTFTITATNGVSPAATQTYTLTVNERPIITSKIAATFVVGTAGNFTVTTTGFPTVSTLSAAGTLPAGVTYTDNSDGTGTFAGTPAALSGGVYPFTITADNGVATKTQVFTLTIDEAPHITSTNTFTFTTAVAGTFPIATTGFPFPAITEKGLLPAGVVLIDNHNGTAALRGKPLPTTGGAYVLTLSASNNIGVKDTQIFTLIVNQAPNFKSLAAKTFIVGTAGAFTISTTGFPVAATITETGDTLPTGVTFVNNGNGTATLAGTPAALTGGTYALTFTADNTVTTNTQSFTLTIDEATKITSANNATFMAGQPATFSVTTTGFPGAFVTAASSLFPPGLHFTPGLGGGTLAGTPTANNGRYSFGIVFSAGDGIGSRAIQVFTATVDQDIAFTTVNHATFASGTAGTAGKVLGVQQTFTIKTTGFPFASFTESGDVLPSGVSLTDLNNGTVTLTGLPAVGTGGTYNITLTASNGVTASATQTFTLTVSQAPHISSANTTSFSVGVLKTFTISTTGFPFSVLKETGVLPGGLTFADNHDGTAVLAGTASGPAKSYIITISGSNGVLPGATQKFTLVVA